MEHLRYLAAVILLLALHPGRAEGYILTPEMLACSEAILVASVLAVRPVASATHLSDAVLLVEDTLKGTVPAVVSGRFYRQLGPKGPIQALAPGDRYLFFLRSEHGQCWLVQDSVGWRPASQAAEFRTPHPCEFVSPVGPLYFGRTAWVAIKVTNLFDLERPPLVVLRLRISGTYISQAFPEAVSVRIVDGVDENGYLFPLRQLEKGQSTIYAVQVICEPTAGWTKVSPAQGFLTPVILTAEIEAREDTRWIGAKSFTLPATAPSLVGFPVSPDAP